MKKKFVFVGVTASFQNLMLIVSFVFYETVEKNFNQIKDQCACLVYFAS